MRSMSADARRGLVWVGVGLLARSLSHASTLVLMLVAARLLSPDDFGAFVLSTALVAFGMLFIYSGAYEYLLRADDTALHADAAFSLLLSAALVLALLQLAGASLAAQWFHSPALADILWAFAVIPLAGCLSAWREALFLRDSGRVMRYNLIVIARDLTSLCIGLAGLWAGWGLAALVAWRLATALLGWLAWRLAVSREPALDFDAAHWRQVTAYGGGITGSRLAKFAEANGVDILLGLMLQPAAVGVYRMASRIVTALVDLLAQPLARMTWVRVSEAARLGRQPQSECALWHGLLLVLAWPVLAFVAVEAPLLTRLLLGPQWVSAGSAVTGLALAAMVRTSTFSLEPLFATAGHSMVLMRLRFVTAGLSLSLVAAGALGGVTAVAYGQVGASAAGVVLIVASARRHAGLDVMLWARSFARPCAVLLGMGLVAWMVPWWVERFDLPHIAVALAPGLVGLLLTAWALWHMRGLLRAISPRL